MGEKPTCRLVGVDGNIFALMSKAYLILKAHDLKDEADEMLDRAEKTENYYDALGIITEYVEVE